MSENIMIEKEEIMYYFNIKGIYNAFKNYKQKYEERFEKIEKSILSKIIQKCQEWIKALPDFYVLSQNELAAWITLSQAVE